MWCQVSSDRNPQIILLLLAESKFCFGVVLLYTWSGRSSDAVVHPRIWFRWVYLWGSHPCQGICPWESCHHLWFSSLSTCPLLWATSAWVRKWCHCRRAKRKISSMNTWQRESLGVSSCQAVPGVKGRSYPAVWAGWVVPQFYLCREKTFPFICKTFNTPGWQGCCCAVMALSNRAGCISSLFCLLCSQNQLLSQQ